MKEVEFNALVKEVKVKALVSLDKGVAVILQGDANMAQLVEAPADKEVKVIVRWNE